MRKNSPSEKLFIEEVTNAARKLRSASKNISGGNFIKFIRSQLGMPQKVLANRAGVPQSTVSRIENGHGDPSISTLSKLFGALECDLLVCPLLRETIDSLRKKQAKKLAEKQVAYLNGTMNLEKQQPDSRFIEELLRECEEQLLHGPCAKLWADK